VPAPRLVYCGAVRVAFVGKGGAGKSVIAGTFARLLALPALVAGHLGSSAGGQS